MKWRKLLAPALGAALLLPGMGSIASADEKPAVDATGVELRSKLNSLLSEHYALAVDSMMKIYEGDPAAEAAQAALDANAEAMEPVIASVYGKNGGAAFEKIFSSHNMGTNEYALAVKNGDEERQQEALNEIQSFVNDMGAFLATATEGHLTENDATEALRNHEDYVQKTFDLYVEGEYEAAYTSYLKGFKQIFGAGSAISGAIAAQFPDKFSEPNTPAGDLDATLSRILAEHFALAQLSLSKGYNGAEDFDFVDWAQDQNTQELREAISSVYNEEATTKFIKLWTNKHISVQGDLASAQAADNPEAINRAIDTLTNAFAEDLGTFLSRATESRLQANETIAAITAHETSVVDTFNQYVAREYETSYKTYHTGYALMFDISKSLSGAIVNQFPENFENTIPDKMPATGLGGKAGQSNTMVLWITLSTLILLTAGTVTYYQSRN